jgi:alkaline phosphatase
VPHWDDRGHTASVLAVAAYAAGGAALVGQLDQLRLFSVARAAQLICTDAGRAHCP